MLPAQPNQSLIDGLTCLQAVVSAAAPQGTRELGRRLGLEPTRVSRLIKTLAHLEMVKQGDDRKYQAGPAIHVLSAQALFASSLLRRALGPLAKLQQGSLIVALGVLWRDQVAYLFHALPGMTAAAALGRVGLYPASRSGIGLPLLACRSDGEVRRAYAGQGVPGFGDGGAGMKALLRELALVRKQGYALVEQDRERQVWSLGVTLGTPEYAALAFSGRIKRRQLPALLGDLRAAARAIELPAATELV